MPILSGGNLAMDKNTEKSRPTEAEAYLQTVRFKTAFEGRGTVSGCQPPLVKVTCTVTTS